MALAVGIPWTAALVLYLTLGATDLIKAAMLANLIFISTPALANVATRLITREGWGRLWLWPKFRRGWPFYLAAILLPFLATIVGGAIFYLVFPQFFDPNLGEVRKLLRSLLRCSGDQSLDGLADHHAAGLDPVAVTLTACSRSVRISAGGLTCCPN